MRALFKHSSGCWLRLWNSEIGRAEPARSNEPNIFANGLTIDFPIYDARCRSLAHLLVLKPVTNMTSRDAQVGGAIATAKGGAVVVRAINGILFEAKKGSRVGLIGHNGAGKTTLLRTLAGIYEPTVGHLDTSGPIMPLFDRGHDTGCDGRRVHPNSRHSARP